MLSRMISSGSQDMLTRLVIAGLVFLSLAFASEAATNVGQEVATFSIVAFDSATGEVGVAVASKFLAVGSVVPWARAGVGAIATQAYANTNYGPEGLRLLSKGLHPREVIDSLTAGDPERQRRQVGIVDAKGNAATYTGDQCIAWAGGKAGRNFACQGNILVDEKTIDAMANAFIKSQGELSVRLLAALKAGERAGGDSRGKQSAALLVVKEKGGYLGLNDRYIDLRVDDHPEPIDELMRLLSIQRSYSALFAAARLRQSGDLAGAISQAKKAVEINPDLAEAVYDLACYYSIAGMKQEAFEALRKAIELAPGFKQMAKDDPDFEPIKGDLGFRALVGD